VGVEVVAVPDLRGAEVQRIPGGDRRVVKATVETIQSNPENAVFGAGLILLGVPVYFAFRARKGTKSPS
jgi:hypothetical protein